MVFIPAGTNSGTNPFDPAEEQGGPDCYTSSYSLSVGPFYMGRTEVSKAEWDSVYAWAVTNGYVFSFPGSAKATNHPVHSVSWFDCVKWCNARSERDQRSTCYRLSGAIYRAGIPTNFTDVSCDFSANGYRLPTTTEWQYAARGGVSSRRFPWADADDIQHSRANYFSTNNPTRSSPNSVAYDTSPTRGYHPLYNDGVVPYTSPVGSFDPNNYGLCDMAGNVFEWNWGEAPNLYVVGLANARGGSWATTVFQLRVSQCSGFNPVHAISSVGFRTVITAGP